MAVVPFVRFVLLYPDKTAMTRKLKALVAHTVHVGAFEHDSPLTKLASKRRTYSCSVFNTKKCGKPGLFVGDDVTSIHKLTPGSTAEVKFSVLLA